MNTITFLGKTVTYETIKNDAKNKAYMIIDFMRPEYEGKYTEDIKLTRKVLTELLKEEPENPKKQMWEDTIKRIDWYLNNGNMKFPL